MRLRIALGLLTLLAVSGCSGQGPSSESVVRAWSQALNAGDNDGAADLFARDAKVVQSGTVLRLATHKQAVEWNAALPCSGRIVAISSHGETARATFLLGNRKTSHCDGPGQRATAIFRVRKGKIVLWHQTANPPPGPAV